MPDTMLLIKGNNIEVTPSQIPSHIVDSVARATLHAVERYFQQPGVQEEYEKWLKEHRRKAVNNAKRQT